MKNFKKVLALVLALVMVLSFAACGGGDDKTGGDAVVYKVGTEPTFPPFDTTDDAGNIIGFDMDLIAAIGEDQGFQVTFENLQFDSAALGYGRDFGDGQLTREHDAAEAGLLKREDAFEVVRDELGGGMDREARKVRAAEARDAEVLYDERVRAYFLQLGEAFDRSLEVAFVYDGVEGDVDLARGWARMRVADEVPEVLVGEILRERAGGKVP